MHIKYSRLINFSILQNKQFLFALITSVPLFISIQSDFSFVFSRSGFGDELSFSLSFPISFIFFCWIVVVFFLKLTVRPVLRYVSQTTVTLIIFSWFLWASYAIIFPDFFRYAVLGIGSWAFFLGVLHSLRNIRSDDFTTFLFLCLFIQTFFGFLSVASNIVLGSNNLGDIFPGFLAIYNFEQYFALGPILCFGLLIKRFKNLTVLGFWFSLVYFLANYSENFTAQIIAVLFLSVGIILRRRSVKIFSIDSCRIMVFFAISAPLLFTALSWCYIEFNLGSVGNPGQSGVWGRVLKYHAVFESLTFESLFIPLAMLTTYGEPHNQFLHYWYYGGFVQAFISFFLISYIISVTAIEHRIFFLLFFVLSGTALEPMGHPFILIQFFIFLAFSVQTRLKKKI